MSQDLRMARQDDFHFLVRVREEWLDRFCGYHPAQERWCPAGAAVPPMEDNVTLLKHLRGDQSDRWAVLLASQEGVDAYMLCQMDKTKNELLIERHNPRVSPRVPLDQAGSQLLELALEYARDRGLQRVSDRFQRRWMAIDPTHQDGSSASSRN